RLRGLDPRRPRVVGGGPGRGLALGGVGRILGLARRRCARAVLCIGLGGDRTVFFVGLGRDRALFFVGLGRDRALFFVGLGRDRTVFFVGPGRDRALLLVGPGRDRAVFGGAARRGRLAGRLGRVARLGRPGLSVRGGLGRRAVLRDDRAQAIGAGDVRGAGRAHRRLGLGRGGREAARRRQGRRREGDEVTAVGDRARRRRIALCGAAGRLRGVLKRDPRCDDGLVASGRDLDLSHATFGQRGRRRELRGADRRRRGIFGRGRGRGRCRRRLEIGERQRVRGVVGDGLVLFLEEVVVARIHRVELVAQRGDDV